MTIPLRLKKSNQLFFAISLAGSLLMVVSYGTEPLFLGAWIGLGLMLTGSFNLPNPGRWLMWITGVMSPPLYHWTNSSGRPDPIATAFGITLLFTPYIAVIWAYFKVSRHRYTEWTNIFFAASWTSYDYLVDTFGGSFTSIAYSQLKATWILQLSAATGYAGITFLLTWSAAWMTRIVTLRTRHVNFAFPTIIALIVCTGYIRTEYMNLSKNPRLIHLVGVVPNGMSLLNANRGFYTYPGIEMNLNPARQLNESLLNAAGKIESAPDLSAIIFPESAFQIEETNRESLRLQIGGLAQRSGKPIVAGVLLVSPLRRHGHRNEVWLFDGSGNFVGERGKALRGLHERLIQSRQLNLSFNLNGAVAVPIICAEFESSSLFRRIFLANEPTINISIAYEWPSIEPIHSAMAVFRAVENGTSLIKISSGGFSFFSDFRGRMSPATRHRGPEPLILPMSVPIEQVRTIFLLGGWTFPWICLVYAFIFLVILFRDRYLSVKLPQISIDQK